MTFAFFGLTLIFALLPVFLILFFVYSKDRFEREPFGKVFQVFFLSALFSFAVIPFERIVGSLLFMNYAARSAMDFDFALNFWAVALVEELYKWLILMILLWSSPCFRYRYDGIVYALASSLGFAGCENVLYLLGWGHSIALGRAIFSIPGHATYGVLMGFFFSRARQFKNRKLGVLSFANMVLSVASATLCHAVYDFLLSDSIQGGGLGLLFFLYVFVMDVIAWMLIYNDFESDCRL